MTNAEYLAWLRHEWCPESLSRITEKDGRCLYTSERVAELAAAYEKLGRWTPGVGQSLEALLTTTLEPYLPARRSGVGIFFRDWPCPCHSDRLWLAPAERGAAPVPRDIMTGAVDRAFGRHGKRYVTVSRGFEAAHAVARVLNGSGPDVETFVQGCVVGDLVKLQAPFAALNGRLLEGTVGKRSCHSAKMYAFAGDLFAEELEHLGLRLAFGFGNRAVWSCALESLRLGGWRVHVPADGRGEVPDGASRGADSEKLFVLLPHPQAYGAALAAAVRLMTGAEPKLTPAEWPEDQPQRRAEVAPPRPPPDDDYYAPIEALIEDHFGGWEIEPYNLSSMRTFRPHGVLSGAIYGRARRGRWLVFHCENREDWRRILPNDTKSGEHDRIHIRLPDLTNLGSLLAPLRAGRCVLDDWR